jgi:hypothetical protein
MKEYRKKSYELIYRNKKPLGETAYLVAGVELLGLTCG